MYWSFSRNILTHVRYFLIGKVEKYTVLLVLAGIANTNKVVSIEGKFLLLFAFLEFSRLVLFILLEYEG